MSLNVKGQDLNNLIVVQTLNHLSGAYCKCVVIDGLFYDNDTVEKLLQTFRQQYEQRLSKIIPQRREAAAQKHPVFKIVCWRLDREACLHNDRGRRTKNSAITIQNAHFEMPDRKRLAPYVTDIEYRNVERKPDARVWADEIEGAEKGKLRSASWSLGGSTGSYTGHTSYHEAEPQPTSFEELDLLLEKMCPQITFLQYKRVNRECVTVETDSSSDCYGGSRNYAYFECDLEKLYGLLAEMGVELVK
jgi:hypothetical protein